VVEEIVASEIPTDAAKKEVTVLFADLKGFTRMSETMDPQRVVAILNGYLRAMSRVITSHRGHVAKFMGDGLMALFGTLERNPWQAREAVLAALAMRRELAAYNRRLRERGDPELSFGIGIHRGVAVVGVIGSEELLEYTAIGDTVNVASRIEGLTRQLDVDILVTEAVAEKLDDEFRTRAMPATAIKGRRESMTPYAIESGPEETA
jgi:adenylate cyclase